MLRIPKALAVALLGSSAIVAVSVSACDDTTRPRPDGGDIGIDVDATDGNVTDAMIDAQAEALTDAAADAPVDARPDARPDAPMT